MRRCASRAISASVGSLQPPAIVVSVVRAAGLRCSLTVYRCSRSAVLPIFVSAIRRRSENCEPHLRFKAAGQGRAFERQKQ
ncbi:hypothetical protein AAHA92_12699 [Salvia divinorum]|uniref:Uncharacterized protein n=1 Tax=Salvia divinorum TaxID=28513 RepID=A0ABD1HL46_SALDI